MYNLYLNYSTTTQVVNTVTETSLLGNPDAGSTKTVSPSIANIGTTFFAFFSGILACTLTPTLTIRLKLGTTTIQAYTPSLNNNPTTAWQLGVYATIIADGAGGTISVHPGAFEFATGTQGAAQWSGRNTGGPTAVDLSVPQDWGLSAQWGTADPADSFTYRFGLVDVVRQT